MKNDRRLTPLLVVRGAAEAIAFYTRAFGATETLRFTHPGDGSISHAELAIGGGEAIAVTEEARAWNSDAPPSLGGSPVVLQLRVDDAVEAFAQATREGAAVVFPLQEFCGERMGRVRDPYGHLWILTQTLEELTVAERQARRAAVFAARSRSA